MSFISHQHWFLALWFVFTNQRNLISRFLIHFLSSFFLSSSSFFPYISHGPPPSLSFLPLFNFSCASLKQTQSPTVKSPATYLHPPPALWSGPIRIHAEGLIMQAAVSPLRWGPPGDSSTASDWGCATEPDSSTNNTEKRMLMDQIRWELRWGSAEEKRRALAGTPDQLSFRRGLVCAIACICCACLSETHWPPRITPPVTDMFSLQSALKFERWRKGVNRGREGLVKAKDGWMWEAIYSALLCSFILLSSVPFPSSIYPA